MNILNDSVVRKYLTATMEAQKVAVACHADADDWLNRAITAEAHGCLEDADKCLATAEECEELAGFYDEVAWFTKDIARLQAAVLVSPEQGLGALLGFGMKYGCLTPQTPVRN